MKSSQDEKGFPLVLESPEFALFINRDLKSPKIEHRSWKSHKKRLELASFFL